jgi:hypothetical protein
MNRVNVGAVGANDRYLAAITALQIKKPTLFTKGFMRVTLQGGDRRRRGVYRAARDVNRVLFSGCGNGQ